LLNAGGWRLVGVFSQQSRMIWSENRYIIERVALILFLLFLFVFLFSALIMQQLIVGKEIKFDNLQPIGINCRLFGTIIIPTSSHIVRNSLFAGGEILSQTYMRHELIVTVAKEGLTIALNQPQQSRVEARISVKLLDNQWHTIQFLHRLGSLNLIVDRNSFVVANATYNRDLLTDQELKNEAAVLVLGRQYSGCLLHGPGLTFNQTEISAENVKFGSCPLAPGQCNPDTDILIRELIDHCENLPCMHGQCISRTDEYECHCPARYGGKNCDKDLGSPCEKNPCRNGGNCQEDRIGNYKCFCLDDFTGKFC
jgi:protein crumbs